MFSSVFKLFIGSNSGQALTRGLVLFLSGLLVGLYTYSTFTGWVASFKEGRARTAALEILDYTDNTDIKSEYEALIDELYRYSNNDENSDCPDTGILYLGVERMRQLPSGKD